MITINPIREFKTGAVRDIEKGKLRFTAGLSPYALEAWVDYLRRHNTQAHRQEENWKKGMPLESYLASLIRHAFHAWKLHDQRINNQELIDAICGVLFNAHGYLHELVKPEERKMMKEHFSPPPEE